MTESVREGMGGGMGGGMSEGMSEGTSKGSSESGGHGALELKALQKSFGEVAVIHGIDLAIREGEFIVFVGPSGCGKSTLLRLIAGLEKPSGGDIHIDGSRVNEVPSSERGLAMVFQSYALYPHMSVTKNLSFGLENLRVEKVEIKRRVAAAAKLLQIEELMERRPGQLSGGQRQRVAIGRAIVRKPRIFLFDEPLSNLDAELRVQMRVEISQLHHNLRNTMIYVTHDQVEAMTMADRIAVLNKGRLEQFGAPLTLYNQPANRFVAGFIGSPRMNFLDGTLSSATSISVPKLGELSLPHPVEGIATGAAVCYGIRPEHVLIESELASVESTLASGAGNAVADTEGGDAAAGNSVMAVAESVEQLGSECYLYCRLDNDQPLTVHHAGQTSVNRGERIRLHFKTDSVHVFDNEGVSR